MQVVHHHHQVAAHHLRCRLFGCLEWKQIPSKGKMAASYCTVALDSYSQLFSLLTKTIPTLITNRKRSRGVDLRVSLCSVVGQGRAGRQASEGIRTRRHLPPTRGEIREERKRRRLSVRVRTDCTHAIAARKTDDTGSKTNQPTALPFQRSRN